VADALALPFEDNTFDLLWSMESGEHMPNKAIWLAECKRVLKPGGVDVLQCVAGCCSVSLLVAVF